MEPASKKKFSKKSKSSGTFNGKSKDKAAPQETDDRKKFKSLKRPLSNDNGSETPSPKKAKVFNKPKPWLKKDKNGKPIHGKKPGETEKPDWNKMKEEKKALRIKRRTEASGADMYELSTQAKKLMEPLRDRKCSKNQQLEQIPKVYSLLKGNLSTVVYSHDMSRVVGVLLKWAHTLELSHIVQQVTAELLPEVVKMSQCNYAVFAVRAMIDYCQPKQRTAISKAFHGYVVKLLSHKFASGVVDRIYGKLKSEDQCELRKELYGASYKLVNGKITSIKVIFENLPAMKESTLKNTKGILLRLFEKGGMQYHMAHSVLADYLNHASEEDCTAVLEQAKSHTKELTGSKEGIHVIMKCLWMSTAKDRKKMLKELKDDVVALASAEHSHSLLLTVFDTVDDTQFVQKALLTPLLDKEHLPTLLVSTYGRKVLVYLCSRRDPKMFTAADIAKLAPGDTNPHSKKDSEIRSSELKSFAAPLLLQHFAENPSLWMEDNRVLLVLLPIVLAGSGETLKAALETLAQYVTKPPNSDQDGIDIRVADNAGCHMVLKKIAQHDKIFNENNEATFGEALVAELTDDHYSAWLKNNRCCFLLLTVLTNGSETVAKTLRSKIKKLSPSVWSKKDTVPLGGVEIKKLL